MIEYSNPETLVSTEWLSQHRNDPGVRVVEVNADPGQYWLGHIEGALSWSWTTQLSDPLRRDILSREQMELLLGQSGITPETTIVLYGDQNNWFAAWAFWLLKIYGHADVRLLNGGKKRWTQLGLPVSLEEPRPTETVYLAGRPSFRSRALLNAVQQAQEKGTAQLVDVRSGAEYRGEVTAPEGSPERPLRGGHIPGAHHFFWGWTTQEDGTFRSRAELQQMITAARIDTERPLITYCRIGERSSHTWFVLKYLLGARDVRNYDGSWMEWGNLIGSPIEVG